MGIQKYFLGFSQAIQNYDMYGKTITFTYKGEDEFKTTFGGCTSIAIIGVIIFYSSLLLKTMLRRDNTTKNTDLLVQDLNNDSQNVSMASTNFSIALGLINEDDTSNANYISDPTYFSVEMVQFYTENGTDFTYSIPFTP